MRDGRIIVTGGSKGIGAAIVADLIRRGFDVVSLSRSGTADAGEAMVCDVTDEDAVFRTVAAIAAKGPIIGLVNNAGLHEHRPSAELPAADFERILRINTTAVLIASRAVYPHLRERGGGLIVNIGSFFEYLGVPDNVAYCASKAAVGAMTRCLAAEWAKDSIRVLDVAPGYIETDLNSDYLAREKVRRWLQGRIPVGRPGRSDEVARLVGMLFVEDIPFLTGETILIDGGQGHNH
jgi:NAD(P)-dependent dehydrogenase (short-subunit alcohol dehydrogenase family)